MVFVLGECYKLASRVHDGKYPDRAYLNLRVFQKVLVRFTTTGSIKRLKRVKKEQLLKIPTTVSLKLVGTRTFQYFLYSRNANFIL